MTESIWLPAVLVFVAAVFLTLATAMISEAIRSWSRRREVARRVKPVLSGQVRRGGDVHDLVKAEEDGGLMGLATRLVPGLRGLGGFLEQGRLDWGPQTFLVLTLGLGLALGLTVLLMAGSLLWFAVAAMLGAALPYFYVSNRRKKRFKQFEEEFPESIDLLTRAIRAGHPLTSGMGMVADEGPPEVAAEFRRAFEEQRFGIPFEEALLGMVDRTDLVDVRIFAIAVLVQREVGGNLAEILDNLAHTVRRRFYLRRQLRIYTAQGRMTGYALGALPIVVGFVLFLLNREYVMLLFTHMVGQVLVVLAVILQILGVLWIRNIINIDI